MALRPELRLTLLLLVLGLALWEAATRVGLISALFFPAPTTILQTFLRMLEDGTLVSNSAITVTRVLLGLLVGGVPGLVVGLILGSSRTIREAVDPIIAAAYPIPKLAVFPLIIVIFGLGESSKVVVIAISAFFPMLISTMAGVREIVPIYFEVARDYGASSLATFRHVVLPGSLPLVMAGTRISLNSALLVCIAVELVQSQSGLGSQIWMAWQTLRTEELYASLLAISLLGILFNLLLQRFAVRVAPWQVEHNL